jgi:hypothetical protein
MTNRTSRFAHTGRPRSTELQGRWIRTCSTLVSTAVDLIVSGSNASIIGVTNESGIIRGGLYFHFDSKTDLIRAVIEDANEQMRLASATDSGAARRSPMVIVDCIASNPVLRAVCMLWPTPSSPPPHGQPPEIHCSKRS